MKFDEYVDDQTFFGLEKLTLNNMVQDESMIHETMAYGAFRAAGLPAPRTGYAFVNLNGEDYGLYLNVETLDRISLPRWFGSTRHLYEAGYTIDVTPDDVADYEVDEGKNKDRTDLEALVAAANQEGGDWSDGVAAVADLEQMTKVWAIERYIGHWDGYAGRLLGPQPNNYYLHSEASGLFRMLPWGTDQTWEVAARLRRGRWPALQPLPRGRELRGDVPRRRPRGPRRGRRHRSGGAGQVARRPPAAVGGDRSAAGVLDEPDRQRGAQGRGLRQAPPRRRRGLARRGTTDRLHRPPRRRRPTATATATAAGLDRPAGRSGRAQAPRRPPHRGKAPSPLPEAPAGAAPGGSQAGPLPGPWDGLRSRGAPRLRRVAPMAEDNSKELFLLDGNSLAYRAFFALPESIATADGRPTNAIYGLASMLVKIIDEHHPGGVVVAWDAGMSGREKTYDLYKAQRSSRPDLLREQWPHLMPLVDAFGYTNVRVEGFEADDVIATLAVRAREEGIPVMVVTGDRDAYQLVGEGIRVMSTTKGISETKIYDSDAVLERYGVPPERVTDLMGLRGDTSDNIPGVPGIGEKTAAQLLQKFGTLEDVLANVEEVSGAKRKQNLVEHADDARMSKALATLQYDLETGVDLQAAMVAEPDRGALRDFMREFELRAVMERLEEALPEGDAVPGRKVETELEIEAVEGGLEDIGEGPLALAVDGDAWAAADREADRHRHRLPRRARGRARRPADRRPRPEERSAAAATACSPRPPARGSCSSSSTTRCSPPTCSSPSAAPTSWSSSPPTPASASPRARGRRRRMTTTASWRWARRSRPGSSRPRKRDWSRRSPISSAPASRSSASRS